jgi:hypothetical protein
MPTHKDSYMSVGQNAAPGETPNVKLQALLNSHCHSGAISLGIRTTWNVSVLLWRAFRSSSRAGSATEGGEAHKCNPFLGLWVGL